MKERSVYQVYSKVLTGELEYAKFNKDSILSPQMMCLLSRSVRIKARTGTQGTSKRKNSLSTKSKKE
jgi:hypothetical protein